MGSRNSRIQFVLESLGAAVMSAGSNNQVGQVSSDPNHVEFILAKECRLDRGITGQMSYGLPMFGSDNRVVGFMVDNRAQQLSGGRVGVGGQFIMYLLQDREPPSAEELVAISSVTLQNAMLNEESFVFSAQKHNKYTEMAAFNCWVEKKFPFFEINCSGSVLV